MPAEQNTETTTGPSQRPNFARAISFPNTRRALPDERQPLIRRRSYQEYEASVIEDGPVVPVAGGTVLGIHNLAIVFPQFIVGGSLRYVDCFDYLGATGCHCV